MHAGDLRDHKKGEAQRRIESHIYPTQLSLHFFKSSVYYPTITPSIQLSINYTFTCDKEVIKK